MSQSQVIRISAQEYVHIKDMNELITTLMVGPQLLVLKDHEKIVVGPAKMIKISPRTYCIIRNPAVRDPNGEVVMTPFGEPKVKFGEQEIRTFENWPEQFPLQVNEVLELENQPYRTVAPETALRIECIRPFEDQRHGDNGLFRFPGDEWLIYGPTTYIPIIEERVNAVEKCIIIRQNQALQVRAKKDFVDRNQVKRYAGETWLIKKAGAYFLDVCEEQVNILKAYVLTDKKAIHIRAKANYTDVYGKERKNGEEWLITNKMNETHILDVHEEFVQVQDLVVMNQRQYCVILNPVKDGKNQWGTKEIRNEVFFLQPGEIIDGGIKNTYILTDNQNLLVRANHDFKDNNGKDIKAGESFLVKGPCTYIPPIQVAILQERPNIQLSHNEGIYVQK